MKFLSIVVLGLGAVIGGAFVFNSVVEESKTTRILQSLEKDPNGIRLVASFIYFKDQCQVTYPRPMQTALQRYARAHPQVGFERIVPMPKNPMEAMGAAFGERLALTIGCPAIKQAIAAFEAQS
jgi:hypothetical protein